MTDRLRRLVSWFDEKPGVIVALSGGVDSALVAHAAFSSLDDSAVAVTADYRTLSSDELNSATCVAKEIGIKHIVITYDELENPRFVQNDKNRCLYCRSELAGHLVALSKSMGVQHIVDGTNIDDLGDYRPGIAAMWDNGIQSPLVDVHMSKDEVRLFARQVGLSVHDRPSNSCLASRIRWGQTVTPERLARIELAEGFIKRMLRIKQIRVRDLAGTARVEVMPKDIARVQQYSQDILLQLKMIGFSGMVVDMEGYSPGKLNVIAD